MSNTQSFEKGISWSIIYKILRKRLYTETTTLYFRHNPVSFEGRVRDFQVTIPTVIVFSVYLNNWTCTCTLKVFILWVSSSWSTNSEYMRDGSPLPLLSLHPLNSPRYNNNPFNLFDFSVCTRTFTKRILWLTLVVLNSSTLYIDVVPATKGIIYFRESIREFRREPSNLLFI